MKSKKNKLITKQSSKVGSVPGTPTFIGEQKLENVIIDIIEYTPEFLKESNNISFDALLKLYSNNLSVKWINIKGIHDINLIENIGRMLNIHPLTLEDLVNTNHRTKIEIFQDYIFFVVKVVKYDDVTKTLSIDHVSLILGENYVVTFSEENDDVFNSVRERITSSKGRIRNMKSDYLAYALVDSVVDCYYSTMEKIGEHIESIEDIVMSDPKPKDIVEIHQLKRDMLRLRKALWPLREEISILQKSENKLIYSETRLFFYDLYEHIIQISDMIDVFREILFSTHDIYLSSVSNKMNETMKLLTVIGTIFIPLTFIVGVYGMNFENMPELKWHWGYYFIWGIMVVISFGMLIFFRRKKWL